MSLNLSILAGNIVRPVALKTTQGKGTSYVSNAIAHNRTYTGDDGKKMQETTFVDFVIWGKSAEFFAKHFEKGGSVLLRGALRQEKWEDEKSKESRSRVVLNVENVDFFGDSKPKSREPGQGNVREVAHPPADAAAPSEPAEQPGEDEIPM